MFLPQSRSPHLSSPVLTGSSWPGTCSPPPKTPSLVVPQTHSSSYRRQCLVTPTGPVRPVKRGSILWPVKGLSVHLGPYLDSDSPYVRPTGQPFRKDLSLAFSTDFSGCPPQTGSNEVRSGLSSPSTVSPSSRLLSESPTVLDHSHCSSTHYRDPSCIRSGEY